jgi:hypothetical protein
LASFTKGKGSSYEFIQGKLSWVKYITPNQWEKWSVQVHPNQESLERIRELQSEGIKNVIKKDDDGYFCTFSRPTSRVIKGKIIGMTPPVVTDKDGQPMEGVAIGNGSDGIVKLEIYTHPTPNGGSAKAARWDALRVTNLIPFNTDTDFSDPVQSEQAKGLQDQQPMF